MRPKKPAFASISSFFSPGSQSLSWTTPCLIAGGLGGAPDRERVLEALGDRLLAIDVLAGGDRAPEQAGAQLGRGGIEEDLVGRVAERGIQIHGPAGDAVGVGQRLELGRIASEKEGLGHHPGAVG